MKDKATQNTKLNLRYYGLHCLYSNMNDFSYLSKYPDYWRTHHAFHFYIVRMLKETTLWYTSSSRIITRSCSWDYVDLVLCLIPYWQTWFVLHIAKPALKYFRQIQLFCFFFQFLTFIIKNEVNRLTDYWFSWCLIGYDNRRKHYSGTTIELIPIFSDMLVRLDSMVLTGAINIGQANLLKGLALKRDAQAADIFSYFRSKSDNELASELLPLIDPNRRFSFYFVFLIVYSIAILGCSMIYVLLCH